MIKKPITQKQFVINNLRKASYKWGPKNDCKKKAKIGYNQYICAKCKSVFPNKDVRVDHINPVVDPVMGFVDWNTYIPRMFCDEVGYQVLCNPCHDMKSDAENEIRKLSRVKKKRLPKRKLK